MQSIWKACRAVSGHWLNAVGCTMYLVRSEEVKELSQIMEDKHNTSQVSYNTVKYRQSTTLSSIVSTALVEAAKSLALSNIIGHG